MVASLIRANPKVVTVLRAQFTKPAVYQTLYPVNIKISFAMFQLTDPSAVKNIWTGVQDLVWREEDVTGTY